MLLAAARDASAYCRSTTCTSDCARDDDGCKTTGEPLFWASRCVGFSVQKDGTANLPLDEVRPVLEAAFLAWTDLPCDTGAASIAFSAQADVACRVAEYNKDAPNANVLLFQDTKWSYKGVDNNLAKTTVTFDTDTGEILDADIEINFAFNEITVTDDHIVYDLPSIVTHEVGHFIGLDHSPDGDATMFAAYEEGALTQRTLELDDIAAACAAYPPEREATCAPEPKNGLGDLCAADLIEEPGEEGGCAITARGPARGNGEVAVALLLAAALGAARRGRRGGHAEASNRGCARSGNGHRATRVTRGRREGTSERTK